MTDIIRVILADDHPLLRRGVATTLDAEPDIEVVAEAGTGDEALALCAKHRPDVLLLDLSMPGPSVTDIIAVLHGLGPETRVVILSAYADEAYIYKMIESGVAGYLLKDEAPELVVTAIRTVMMGTTWFSGSIVSRIALHHSDAQDGQLVEPLTEREHDVLELVALGWSNARIAEHMHLAEQTVRNYVSRIYSKLDITTRAEAVVWAREHGFGDP